MNDMKSFFTAWFLLLVLSRNNVDADVIQNCRNDACTMSVCFETHQEATVAFNCRSQTININLIHQASSVNRKCNNGAACCVNDSADCIVILAPEKSKIGSQCNGKQNCSFTVRRESVSNNCSQQTVQPTDYVTVTYRCLPAVRPISTPTAASSTMTTGNYTRTTTFQRVPDKTTAILVQSTQASEKLLPSLLASHRDAITIGVGGLLVLVIVILAVVVCRRKKRQSAAVRNGRGRHKPSIASCNYYSPVEPVTPDITSFPSSPMYALPHEIEMRFNVTDGRQQPISQYLPMEGNKKNSQLTGPLRCVEDTSAYVLEDHSAAKGQQQLATSVSFPTDYNHQLNPAAATDSLTPRFTKTLNSISYSTGTQQRQPTSATDNRSVMHALSKPKPAVNRRKNTGSSRQRPASTDQLFDHATGLYEEIPADIMTLPVRQHSSSRFKYRPQPPTPDSPSEVAVTDRPTAAPLRRNRTRRRTESDNNKQQVWYSCSDVTLLGPVDMLDGPEVADVKQPEAEDIGKMQRKSSYDESDTILIDSAIYG